jgi:hypothetical protein
MALAVQVVMEFPPVQKELALHCTQSLASRPLKPGLQRHEAMSLDPSGEWELVGQVLRAPLRQ